MAERGGATAPLATPLNPPLSRVVKYGLDMVNMHFCTNNSLVRCRP